MRDGKFRNVEAVLFDYGNTLIEFGRKQFDACNDRIWSLMHARLGAADRAHFDAIRQRDLLAPFVGDPPSYREHDLDELHRNTIRSLYGVEAEDSLLRELKELRTRAFVEEVQPAEQMSETLEKIAARFRIGLVSNFPDGEAIRRSLDKLKITRFFETVVVSADGGYVKPHPAIFGEVADLMQLNPARTIFVGDNWLADIQGASRAGMSTVWTQQYISVENFSRRSGDAEPDAMIGHLTEIVDLL